MSKKFAAFDMDGTLFRSGLYREVITELIELGALPESILTALADKEQAWKKRTHGSAFGEFEEAMAMAMDEHLPQIKISYFELAVERVVHDHKDNVYVYTRELAKRLKSEGYTLIAISGSQEEVVEPFAQHYGFDHVIGQRYERGDEFLAGVERKTHKGKGKFLKQLVEEYGLTFKDSVAVGDTNGDIEMLELVENPIAFNPEQNLYQTAAERGWKIVIERKNMMYELEPDGEGQYRLHAANPH
jgi:HAD superfamily hydrolase (TIGR01490 family)